MVKKAGRLRAAKRLLLLGAVLWLVSSQASAAMAAATPSASPSSSAARPLVIGTKEAPPFAMKTAKGNWTGISIELWRHIANELNLDYEWQETDLQGLLDGVAEGRLDGAVAALTITGEREQRMDFTHPFHTTGLGIAAATTDQNPWLGVVYRFLSPAFLKVVAALCGVLLLVGLAIWWFEHRRNPNQFGGTLARGIASGFWWSAVTMTTVGYGDKAPVTFGGRLLAIIWMFAAIIIISSFTAAITSSLTISGLAIPIKGLDDLHKLNVGTVRNATSEAFLLGERISHRPFATAQEGMAALAAGRLHAFVYDKPLLLYLVNSRYKETATVLPNQLLRQDYGIALPAGSPLREPINRVLLQKLMEDSWQEILFRYLGGPK